MKISMCKLISLCISLLICINSVTAQDYPSQSTESLSITPTTEATVEAITNHGTFSYHLDNSGKVEVSEALQSIFNHVASLENATATIIFSPGVYYLNSPIVVKIAGVKLLGNGHGGIDIHGTNVKSGTIFHLGKGCAPRCFTFDYAGRTESFPAGEHPWGNENIKVELENLTFVGYNNTGVNTADGYSRFRNDTPNFRGLNWYPSKDRYEDVEEQGQRAIFLPKGHYGKSVAKCELFRVTDCYFTDLYVALDVEYSDVSYINKNWFGQLTYAVRFGSAPGMMVSNNLFADLESAIVVVDGSTFSTYHNNTFAYVSKCFEMKNIVNSTISDNAVYNWSISTGAAAFGSFCHVDGSQNLSVMGNSVTQQLDSRKRTITVDEEPNGESFIQFDKAENLMFANNIINTIISQTVVRLNDCNNCVVVDNIIRFAEGGNAVAETGSCSENYYRAIDPKTSSPFDEYKY